MHDVTSSQILHQCSPLFQISTYMMPPPSISLLNVLPSYHKSYSHDAFSQIPHLFSPLPKSHIQDEFHLENPTYTRSFTSQNLHSLGPFLINPTFVMCPPRKYHCCGVQSWQQMTHTNQIYIQTTRLPTLLR